MYQNLHLNRPVKIKACMKFPPIALLCKQICPITCATYRVSVYFFVPRYQMYSGGYMNTIVVAIWCYITS